MHRKHTFQSILRNIFSLILTFCFVSLLYLAPQSAYAQGASSTDSTIIPLTSKTYEECKTAAPTWTAASLTNKDTRNDVLACAVITGRVKLFMIPYYIIYLIEVLINLAVILCVFFIVIGGFQYALSGLTDEKEKGKKTVMNAVIGLIIAALSWIIINVIQYALTKGSP